MITTENNTIGSDNTRSDNSTTAAISGSSVAEVVPVCSQRNKICVFDLFVHTPGVFEDSSAIIKHAQQSKVLSLLHFMHPLFNFKAEISTSVSKYSGVPGLFRTRYDDYVGRLTDMKSEDRNTLLVSDLREVLHYLHSISMFCSLEAFPKFEMLKMLIKKYEAGRKTSMVVLCSNNLVLDQFKNFQMQDVRIVPIENQKDLINYHPSPQTHSVMIMPHRVFYSAFQKPELHSRFHNVENVCIFDQPKYINSLWTEWSKYFSYSKAAHWANHNTLRVFNLFASPIEKEMHKRKISADHLSDALPHLETLFKSNELHLDDPEIHLKMDTMQPFQELPITTDFVRPQVYRPPKKQLSTILKDTCPMPEPPKMPSKLHQRLVLSKPPLPQSRKLDPNNKLAPPKNYLPVINHPDLPTPLTSQCAPSPPTTTATTTIPFLPPMITSNICSSSFKPEIQEWTFPFAHRSVFDQPIDFDFDITFRTRVPKRKLESAEPLNIQDNILDMVKITVEKSISERTDVMMGAKILLSFRNAPECPPSQPEKRHCRRSTQAYSQKYPENYSNHRTRKPRKPTLVDQIYPSQHVYNTRNHLQTKRRRF